MKIIHLLPFILFMLLAVIFGFVLIAGHSSEASPLLQKPVPAFALNTYQNDKKILTEKSLQKPALLVFWASWCGVCRVDLPILSRVAQQEHLPLYGIAYRDTPLLLDNVFKEMGKDVTFTAQAIDYSGETSSRFGLIGVPTLFAIDKNGFVAFVKAGSVTEKELKNDILPTLR
jgi:cytochrome c biogenesis protein CcmG/thiol:disulfide interchange protein DsbE